MLNKIKLGLIIVASSILSACNNPQTTNNGNTAQIESSAQAVATVETPTVLEPTIIVEEKPKKTRRAKLTVQESTGNENPVLATTTMPENPAVNHWEPNEAHLFRGGELVNGLRKELGRQPSTAEMQKLLQTHMGLSPTQAQKLLAALNNAN